jgi:2-oxoisovalerate dehydrogenase E1 component
MEDAKAAIDYVRSETKPGFFLVETFRLNPHSKGDDDRSADEIQGYREKDYLTIFSKEQTDYYNNYAGVISREINDMVEHILTEREQYIEEYYEPGAVNKSDNWLPAKPVNKRQVELLNTFFKENIVATEKMVFLGEDILSPYGGAFKVAKDLSFIAPEKVFSTPISESAIMGISNGLALNGFKPFAEIMFGDFITLAFDQIVNHASKFHHMFNKKANCPVVVRTPMGGHRGYGPTHSQTLDKFLIGIDNVKTLAINTFFDPAIVYNAILKEVHPVIVIENKTDYGKKILHYQAANFVYEINEDVYPVIQVRPVVSAPDITIVAYGGMADLVNNLLGNIFLETDLKPILIIPSLISALPVDIIARSAAATGRLVVIEEGSAYGGIGAELIAQVTEMLDEKIKTKRIASLPVPIPSVKSLEQIVLPDKQRILKELKAAFA